MTEVKSSIKYIDWGKFENDTEVELWAFKAKLHLSKLNEWDNTADKPQESEVAYNQIVYNLNDEYLLRWFKLVPTKTLTKTRQIWNEITKLFQQTTTSTKVSSTLTLTNFSFDGRKAVDVKKAYEAITRHFQAAFGGQETISVAHLSACLLLAKLPEEFSTIRTIIEQQEASKQDETLSFLNVEKIFESVIIQEASNNLLSQATAALAKTPAQGTCHHNREQSSCWTCNPKIAPVCFKCKTAGLKFRHVTDSHWCKRQQPKASASVAFDLANPTVWNNDSGASHNITPHGDKAGISPYSSSSTKIQIADGSVIHSTGIGKHISLPEINNVLICPKISHNLLSTGAMADNGIDSLFTKDSVIQGDF